MKKIIFVTAGLVFLAGCTQSTNISNNLINENQEVDTKNVSSSTEFQVSSNGDFSGKGLDAFPREVLSQKSLKTLDISNNSIRSLPSEIGELSKIEYFNVSRNKLTGSLPAEIRMMANLKVLNASNNGLTGIPAEIGQLSKIEKIDLSSNNIDSFPLEIANIKSNLKELNISNNSFSSDKINELKNLLPNTLIIN